MDRSIEITSMDFHQVYWVTGICDPSKSREQHHCSLKLGSNPPVVTGICDLYKSWARHHLSFKLGLKLKCLKINNVWTFNLHWCSTQQCIWKKIIFIRFKAFHSNFKKCSSAEILHEWFPDQKALLKYSNFTRT